MIDWDALVLGPCLAQFAEAVDYTPAGGAMVTVTGVYDEQYTAVDMLDGQGVTSAMPVLGVQLSQFVTPPQQGDALTIVRTSEAFLVKEVRPDGHGWAKLLLNASQ